MRQAITLARALGRIMVAGGLPKPVKVGLVTPLLRDRHALSSHCYGIQAGHADFQTAADIPTSIGLRPEDIVTYTLPLARFEEAFDITSDKWKGAVKIQIAP